MYLIGGIRIFNYLDKLGMEVRKFNSELHTA